MTTVRKTKIRKIFVVLIVVVFLELGIYLIYQSFQNKKNNILSYKENNEIHYKAFLKPNSFFDTPYLEEDKTYITSLIDHLNIDYNYVISFNKPVSGEYTYYLEAVILADKSNNESGNYWTKSFRIGEAKKATINNQKRYVLVENIDVDYNKYNDLLNEFKKSTGVTTDSKLSIRMVVEGNVQNGELKAPINSNLNLTMPLSELAIEGKIDKDAISNKKTIKKKYTDDSPKYFIYRMLGSLFVIVSMGTILVFMHRERVERKKNVYIRRLKKILNTYDSIIVTLQSKPDFKKYNEISVASFEELIDAHSEVRMPINYYQDEHRRRSYFTLINGNEIYTYTLKADVEEEKANEEKKIK